MKKILFVILLFPLIGLSQSVPKTFFGSYQFDSLYSTLTAKTDTGAYKPVVMGSDGQYNKLAYWPAGGGGGGSNWTVSGSQIYPTAATFVGIGLTSGITSPLHIGSSGLTNSQARIGALEIQASGIGNVVFGDNVYYNGTNYVRRGAGFANSMHFYGNEAQFRMGANGILGSTVTNAIPFKINQSGVVALGGDVSVTNGSYTGATAVVNTTGIGVGLTAALSPLHIATSGVSNPQVRIGALEMQSYAMNNLWFGDNTYFNGTNFLRRNSGFSGLFYFAGPEGQFRMGASAAAGTTVTQILPFKVNFDGTATLGGNVSSAVNTYTGATLLANNNGVSIGTAAAPTSTLQVSGTIGTSYTETATGITAGAHSVINVTATGQTITLPTAIGITGRHYTIKFSGVGTGTVATSASQTIDGAATYSLTAQFKHVTVQSTGSNWIIIGNN